MTYKGGRAMRRSIKPLIFIIIFSMLVALSLLCTAVDPAQASPGDVLLVSSDSSGILGNDHSGSPCMSPDGRFVAFSSQATNLVPGGTSGYQVFRKDLDSGEVALVSCDSTGNPGNGGSYAPAMSPDGRFVVFHSEATNLVPGGTAGRQVFRKDLLSGAVALVSCDAAGNPGNGASEYASLSSGGRYVAFDSVATNLVTPATSSRQVFRKDLVTGAVALVSCDEAGNPGNSAGNIAFNARITPDGAVVSFRSDATNLIPGGTTGRQGFMKEMSTGEVELVSCDASRVEGDDNSGSPLLTPDLKYAVFASEADNLVPGSAGPDQQIFRKDLSSGEVVLVSCDAAGTLGNGRSEDPSVSSDGSCVAFTSPATNLVPGGTVSNRRSIFRKDLITGEVALVSCDSSGTQADQRSNSACISSGGLYVAFASVAGNLIPGGSSGWQIFRKELSPRLRVTGIIPDQGTQFTFWLNIALEGEGFQPGAAVRLEKDSSMINAWVINVVSDYNITFAIGLFGVEPGVYDVVVTNPDTKEARLEDAFTVTPVCGEGGGMAVLMLGVTLGLLSLGGTMSLRRKKRRRKA